MVGKEEGGKILRHKKEREARVVTVDANTASQGYGQNAGTGALSFFISDKDRRCSVRPYEVQDCWGEFS